MENTDVLKVLKDDYLKEYRRIKMRLLEDIQNSSYLNVQLHDIANQLYALQLRDQMPQEIYGDDFEGFCKNIIKEMPEPLQLRKQSAGWNKGIILILAVILICVSGYAIYRNSMMETQRSQLGYLQESSAYRTAQSEVKKKLHFSLDPENYDNLVGQVLYDEEGNTITISDIEEQKQDLVIYLESSGPFSNDGGSIVSVVEHSIGKKQKVYSLYGSVVMKDAGEKMQLPWMYLSVSKNKNMDEYGFRLSKDLLTSYDKLDIEITGLMLTTWTKR